MNTGFLDAIITFVLLTPIVFGLFGALYVASRRMETIRERLNGAGVLLWMIWACFMLVLCTHI